MTKIGRNDICPCGSGKKYKKCCINLSQNNITIDEDYAVARKTDSALINKISRFFQKQYPDALVHAWEEFYCYDDDMPAMEEEGVTFVQAFFPWLLYEWIPNLDGEYGHYPERTVAEEYLLQKHYSLTKYEKDFILSNIKSNYSIYEIIGGIEGGTLRLRDILRGKEIDVREIKGSKPLNIGYVLLARVVELEKCNILGGISVERLSADYIITFIKFRQHYKKNLFFKDGDLFEYDIEIRSSYFGIVKEAHNPIMPRILNTDGDELEDVAVIYELKISIEKALSKLSILAVGISEEEILEDAIYNEKGEIEKVFFPWLVEGNEIHKHWGNTVYGRIEIVKGKLIIDINSERRTEEIREKIDDILGSDAKLTVDNDPLKEGILKNVKEADYEEFSIEESKLVELELLEDFHKSHWTSWLDIALSALDGQTPREASKTKKGKEMLEGLFSLFHQRNIEFKVKSGMLPVDLVYLRKELGML